MACPLCGAHPGDADCMDVTDVDVLQYAEAIEELHSRLQELRQECPAKNACSLAGNEGHLNCTVDPELVTLIRNEAADAAAERIENERKIQH